MGQHCPIKCTHFPCKKENIFLPKALELNSASETEGNWPLKGSMLKVNKMAMLCFLEVSGLIFILNADYLY
jgi:hypothetical protein